jgi:hypothetical protein
MCSNLKVYDSNLNNKTEILELSDIYPAAFLCCAGLSYKVKTESTSNGKRRVIFVFEDKAAQELCHNFYVGQADLVSANHYSRILKELKSLVHNY